MEPTRCHFTVIFENVVKFFWQLLPSVFIPIVAAQSLKNAGLIILLAVIGVFLLALLIQFLIWQRTWLAAESDQLSIRSGLFWKKQVTIPYEKINTIDLSRNLYQRVFGTCRLKVDTGAVTGGEKKGAEVNLVFTLAQAEEIRAHILALAAGTVVTSLHDGFIETPAGELPEVQTADGSRFTRPDYQQATDVKTAPAQPAAVLHAGAGDFFLYGLTESKLLAIVGLLFGSLAFAAELLDEAVFEWIGSRLEIILGQVTQWQFLSIFLVALAFIVAFYLIANAVSILFAIVRFFNFRASRNGSNIHIEYGLLTAKSYTIPVKNIHAVIITQNLSRQIMRFCSVELVSIGYGDEKNEVALLIPLIRLAQLESALNKILPEYQENLTLQPAPRAAARRFLLIPLLLVIAAVLIVSQFWAPIWYSLLILLPWIGLSRWLNYRNAGIGYSADRLEIRSGGFTRKRSRVRLNAVQSVSAHSHPFIERAGLKSYRVDYHAPALRSVIHVRFLEEKHLDELRRLLDQSEEN